MSNGLEKDTIGEHEGWLNNPFLTFFVGIVLLCLFSILGNTYHTPNRAKSASEQAREARFQKIEAWRNNPSNQVDLESFAIIDAGENKDKKRTYQIPLSEAREILINEYKSQSPSPAKQSK